MVSPIETLNTVPGKHVFALYFLQSLSKLRTQNNTSERVKKIKTAAYAAMARAAGGKNRMWSRSLLWRIRGRVKDRNNKIIKGLILKRRRVGNGGGRRRRRRNRIPATDEATERLRRLVPGGGGMETSRLMEETAHYIKCLSMQVKVMQRLVDGLSA